MTATQPCTGPITADEFAAITADGCEDVKGAMAFLKASRSEVNKWLSNGTLWSFKRGRCRRIPKAELRRLLARQAMDGR